MKRFAAVGLCAATLICPLVISAGKASAGEVRNREMTLQQRIDQGAANNSIRPWEARNLERQVVALNATRQHDLSRDGGHLTAQDDRRLNRRESEISQAIHRDESNGVRIPMQALQN